MSFPALQILLNSLIAGLLLGLVAVGFTYVFRVAKVFHLAHAGVYVISGYTFWWCTVQTGSWVISATVAAAIAVLVSYGLEKLVYLPLSGQHANQSISLIASIGVYAVAVNTLVLLFGNENQTIKLSRVPFGSLEIGSLILTNTQVFQIVIAIFTAVSFATYLKLTDSSLTLRAVADNENSSMVLGVNTRTERVKVFSLAALVVCAASILRTVDIGIEPKGGMAITLSAVVVSILISRLDLWLILVCAVALTLLQNTVEWYANTQWRDAITFLILILVILFRTEGVISYNLRRDVA